MKTVIKNNHKLSEIQEVFNKHFPSLKIEFFTINPTSKSKFSKENMIADTSKTISQLIQLKTNSSISFNGNQKASTLENNFLKNFGLNIQVFRRSGKNWLETSTSDDWTLAQQNRKGIETSFEKNKETPPDFDQYHEQP